MPSPPPVDNLIGIIEMGREEVNPPMDTAFWRVSGSYLEACNCQAMWTQSANHGYFKQLPALAGFPGRDWYELRHCVATILLEGGVTLGRDRFRPSAGPLCAPRLTEGR